MLRHLNCATMCPRGGRWLGGSGGPLAEAPLVAHCLLVEAGDGLALVDTGLGRDDVAAPRRLGQPFRALVRPTCRESETAIGQIEMLGLDPRDVRDVVLTHLDVDHAGGLADFPEARARSQEELKQENGDQVTQILGLFYALLAMSVLISVFGIVNTLTLSIHERTRELGLLRAVGMTRREVRRMVRYESVITAAIGAVLGLALGLFFAFVVIRALAGEGIVFALPVGQIVAFLVFGILVGVVAAILPARRASRLDVLQAIAHE